MAYRSLFLIALAMGFLAHCQTNAFGGWQADQPAAGNPSIESPFSLDNTIPSAHGEQRETNETQASGSPFSLPDKKGESPASPQSDTGSPFALPSQEVGTVDNTGQPEISKTEVPQIEKSADELYNQGMEYARAGRYDEARVALAQSIQKNPENVVALNNLGLVMRKLGRNDDAVQAYQYALQVDPNYALTYKNLGVLFEKQGENELAAEAYREYCRLAPDAADNRDVYTRAYWLDNQK